MTTILSQVTETVNRIVSYDNLVGRVVPSIVKHNAIYISITQFFFSLFNQRNIITLPINFCINFFPVWLWLWCFRNAGGLSTEWRTANVPINDGVTKEWDAKYFSFDVYGVGFLMFHLCVIIAWIKVTQLVTKWSSDKEKGTLQQLKQLYYHYHDISLSDSVLPHWGSDIELQKSTPTTGPQFYLDVNPRVGPRPCALSTASGTSIFDSDIEMDDIGRSSSSTTNSSRGLNALIESDIEDSESFGDNSIHNVRSSSSSSKGEVLFNPKLQNSSNTTTKSLKDLFAAAVPFIYNSNLPQYDALLVIGVYTALSWFTLNAGQFFATPISPSKDVLAFVFYIAMHAVAPITTAIYLYIFQAPGAVAGFSYAMAIQNIAGVWTHLLWPSTPPWFHTLYEPGTIPTYQTPGSSAGLYRIAQNWHMMKDQFNDNKIVFGALPSLHSAVAVQSMFFILYYCRNNYGRAIAITYVTVQWWATIYLEHHWRLDLICGMWYSLAALCCVLPYLLFVENRFKKTRFVDCDASSPHFRTFGMRLFQYTKLEYFFDPYYTPLPIAPPIEDTIDQTNGTDDDDLADPIISHGDTNSPVISRAEARDSVFETTDSEAY